MSRRYSEFNYGSVYRTLCDVLQEMRKCHKTHNYAHLLGLIEEAQTMANRMEAGLDAKKDFNYYKEKGKELRLECKKLETELNKLEKKKGSKS